MNYVVFKRLMWTGTISGPAWVLSIVPSNLLCFFPWLQVASFVLSTAHLETQGPPFSGLWSSHSVQLSSTICPASSNCLLCPWLLCCLLNLGEPLGSIRFTFPVLQPGNSSGNSWNNHRSHLICFLSLGSLSTLAWCPVSWNHCFIYFVHFFSYSGRRVPVTPACPELTVRITNWKIYLKY